MRKSFINAPENRYRYCAFSILRNKINLLHPFMNKKDELFAPSVKGLRHRRQSKKLQPGREIIGLSQSAVSHSVKELEHQTGVRLLDRTTREVVLTEAGQQLAGRLERLLDELNSTLRDAGRVGQQLTGTVRVAASQTISAHLIPQCIAHSNQRYPEIDFVLHDRPQQWVLESIRQGVDFGIVIDPGAATDLQCETVLAEPFCFYVGRIILLPKEYR
jgi:hypothetical protein